MSILIRNWKFQTVQKLALVLSLMMALTFSASAQSPYSAAYRVNSSVITYYELDQMQRLLEGLGRGGDDIEQVTLDTLINARLLDQEANRIGLEVDDVSIQRALERLTDQPEQFRADLARNGIAPETLDTYLRAQLILSTYLDIKGISLDITPDEISSRILQIPDQVVPVIYIAEIVIPYAEYGGRLPARLRMTQALDAMRAGSKTFQQTAREISRSPTASNGGVIGPIPREGLNGQLASIVNSLAPGQIATPIETEGAVILIQYVGPSEIRNSLPRTPTVSYTEIFIPANGNLAQSKADAERVAQQAPTCQQANTIGAAQKYDNVAVSSLTSGVSLALARLETGENSVFEREDGTSVLYLCERSVVVPEQYQQGVEAAAANEAQEDRARGAMQELRNIANIVKVQ